MSRSQSANQSTPIDYPEDPPPQSDLKSALRVQIKRRFQADLESLARQRQALTLYYHSQMAAVDAIADDLEVIEEEVPLSEDATEVPTAYEEPAQRTQPARRAAPRSTTSRPVSPRPADNGMDSFEQEDLGLGPNTQNAQQVFDDVPSDDEDPDPTIDQNAMGDPDLDEFAQMEDEGPGPRLRDVLPQRRRHANRQDLAAMSEEELQEYQAQMRAQRDREARSSRIAEPRRTRSVQGQPADGNDPQARRDVRRVVEDAQGEVTEFPRRPSTRPVARRRPDSDRFHGSAESVTETQAARLRASQPQPSEPQHHEPWPEGTPEPNIPRLPDRVPVHDSDQEVDADQEQTPQINGADVDDNDPVYQGLTQMQIPFTAGELTAALDQAGVNMERGRVKLQLDRYARSGVLQRLALTIPGRGQVTYYQDSTLPTPIRQGIMLLRNERAIDRLAAPVRQEVREGQEAFEEPQRVPPRRRKMRR